MFDSLKLVHVDTLIATIKSIDSDNDGYITIGELKNVYRAIKKSVKRCYNE